jgi:anti-anti-sigma factor
MHVSSCDSSNPTRNASDCMLFLTGSNEGSSYVLHATGELDLCTRHLVELACPTSRATNVIVDLAKLTFMDCSGYSGIETARDRLETIGGTLTLRSARGPVL